MEPQIMVQRDTGTHPRVCLLGLKGGLLFPNIGIFHYVNRWLPSKKIPLVYSTCTAISPPVPPGSVPFLDTRNNRTHILCLAFVSP